MDKRFYITTPIYYVNAEPHLGHAYTTIVADVMKRFYHLMGFETHFVTGTDEHGDKVLQAATERGMRPKEYVDFISEYFRELWPKLRCEHDDFIRTTDPRHVKVVQYLLQKVYDAGDIYFGRYEGLYCTGCERFYTERELDGGLCPQHGKPPEPRSEENYFFKMSRYQRWLLEHLDRNPDFVRPPRYMNELKAMLEEPLEDLCISRPKSRLQWGIPLPFDERYVTYVWFDALINYISALGYPDGELFGRFWPYAQHLIAKDILKPHGIYWPTMLKAAGIEPYRHLNVHGYWNVEEAKMSKSLGNVVRPLDLVEKYGLDAFRYFLMREMVFGLDANFSELSLVQRLNADLANDLGNLLQRTLTMAHRYLKGRVPLCGPMEPIDYELRRAAEEVISQWPERMSSLRFHQALIGVWELIGETNRYIDRTEPFRLAKDPTKKDRLNTLLYCALEANRIISLLIWPVMPGTAEQISIQLGIRPPGQMADIESLGRWGILEAGHPLGPPQALFPRVDLKEAGLDQILDTHGKQPHGERGEAGEEDEVTIEEFKKLDLRVAHIQSAERVEGSDRLMALTVDIGPGKRKKIVAGLAVHYDPKDLVGRQVIVVCNLRPAKIFGMLSEGMLLAADDGEVIRLVVPDGPTRPGTKVR